MKLSDLLIALCYWVSSKVRIILLSSILLLNFSSQIKASVDSFNISPNGIGIKGYSTDSIVNKVGNDLTLRDAVNLALLHNPELAAFSKEIRA